MKILLIDNYDSFTYNLVHMVEDITGTRPDVKRNRDVSPSECSEYTHLMISPGPGLPADAGNLLDILKYCWTTHHIYGVCLGMQALAEADGAQLKQLKRVYHGVEDDILITERSAIYAGISDHFKVGRYHSWVVDDSTLASHWRQTAHDRNGQLMSMEHKTLPIAAVQYHPESIMTPDGHQILRNFIVE